MQKFGGTSVANVERIQNVAERCVATQKQGHDVAVVVSAMSGETDRLLGLATSLMKDRNDREFDVVVSTGEQVTAGLLALAIRSIGGQARSLLGHQVQIRTDSYHARARIQSIDASALDKCFSEGKIAVIAGFQGQDEHGDITTLGRGGSDTSAVAVAAATKADVCEIYTDVDGVFTTDPRIEPKARKIDKISYEEMLELSSLGAKVLQLRSVEFGMKYDVPIHVRSSFHEGEGTWVVAEDKGMEKVMVSGVAVDRNEAKITVRGVPDQPGIAWKIFAPLSKEGIVVDMIIQNMSSEGVTDMSFTVPRSDLNRAVEQMKYQCTNTLKTDPEGVVSKESIAKVSVVGVGMRSHAGVAEKMFEILAAEKINIQMISTSEIKVSCVIDDKYAELAVRSLHNGFGLANS